MAKKAKGKHRLDKFYYLAKEQGYRARSAFKLVQLNRKYDFLKDSGAVLDLCAAPGGWLQVAQKYMPMSSTIVGIDLAKIKPIRGVTTLVEDITTESCRSAVRRVTPDGVKYDCVLHDGAPNVGGNYAKEAYSQAALTLDALKLATEFLKVDGWFVTKVFRSSEYHALLYAFQQLFKKVESTKPVASRDSSAEIFVVCKGYLAPTKIDPRLLKADSLFASTDDEAKKGQQRDVLKVDKAKRNRSGYEDGLNSLYKETFAENFIHHEKPAEMLGMYHTFLLDGSKGKKGTNVVPPKEGFMDLDECEETTDEIRLLFKDLGVLNKSDFKMLLKWRLQIRKRLGLEEKKSVGANGKRDGEKNTTTTVTVTEEDENERLLNEMEELQGNMDAEARRKKKKNAKMKQKDRIRTQLGLKGDGEAVVAEEDLFSLVRLKSKEDVKTVANQAAPSVPADYYEDSDSELNEARRKQNRYDSEDSDAENDVENDTSRLDSSLNALYKQYKERQKKKGKTIGEASKGRDKRATLEDDEGELAEDEDGSSSSEDDDDDDDDEKNSEETRFEEDDDEPLEWENDDDDGEKAKKKKQKTNDLVVGFDPSQVRSSAKASADRWFSNDLFTEIEKSAAAPIATNKREKKQKDVVVDEKPFVVAAVAAAEKKKSAEKASHDKMKKQKKKKSTDDDDDEDEDDYESLREQARAKKLEKAKEAAQIAKEGELKTKQQQDKLEKKRKKTAGNNKKGDTTYDSDSDDVDVGRKKRAMRAEAEEEDFDVAEKGDSDNDDDDDDKHQRRRRADGSESDDSTDVDELSDGTRAEILAISKKMLRRKEREEIIEDAYNRFAFEDDPRDLPDWFVDDERKFMRADTIYDHREYEEALQSITIKVDERSIKKVAEAKLRKKKRARDKMSEARQRAGAIMDQTDIPDVSKVREIESIYAKANRLANGKKKQIKHVVARKMHKGNAGGPSVDKRMLSDRRGEKASMKRGGAGAGGGKKGGNGGGKKGGKAQKKKSGAGLRKNKPRR